MDYQQEKSNILQKNFDRVKGERVGGHNLGRISLKDMPLEDRRKEAKKPLFLIRYE